MTKLPVISSELIEYLEGICPDAVPQLTDSEREVWSKAGKVHLVRHLKAIHLEQNENILGGT